MIIWMTFHFFFFSSYPSTIVLFPLRLNKHLKITKKVDHDVYVHVAPVILMHSWKLNQEIFFSSWDIKNWVNILILENSAWMRKNLDAFKLNHFQISSSNFEFKFKILQISSDCKNLAKLILWLASIIFFAPWTFALN